MSKLARCIFNSNVTCSVNATKCDECEIAVVYNQGKKDANKWIPITEELPKDRNTVLVTAYWHETYQVMMGTYFGDGEWWCVPFNNCGEHMQKLTPKAWMPLVEPYLVKEQAKC